MTQPAATSTAHRPGGPDKREAILDAALRMIARFGLHNTPMSAIAREAGVAAGTLYLYFPSKEAMINALYLELLGDRDRATTTATSESPAGDVRTSVWHYWRSLARWHLDHRDASNLLHQCQASGILADETRAFEQRARAEGLAHFEAAIAAGHLRDLPVHVFWALFAGPIFLLAQMRDAGEAEVTEELLRETFDGVCRSVLPGMLEQ